MSEEIWVYRSFQTREGAEYFMLRFKQIDFDWSVWKLKIREIEPRPEGSFQVGMMVDPRYESLVESGLHSEFNMIQPLTFGQFDSQFVDLVQYSDNTKANKARKVVMTFGKYVGVQMGDIPIHYLDQTVSSMPNQWIVRQAHMVVDWAMEIGGNEKTLNERINVKSSD